MEHLPPVGWADVATKSDLQALETRIGLRFEQIDLRFDRIDLRFDGSGHRLDSLEHRLRAEFQRDLRTTTLAVLAGNAAIVSVAAAFTNLF